MEKQKVFNFRLQNLRPYLLMLSSLVESQSSYAGGSAVNRIFILVTKFIFILGKEKKKGKLSNRIIT